MEPLKIAASTNEHMAKTLVCLNVTSEKKKNKQTKKFDFNQFRFHRSSLEFLLLVYFEVMLPKFGVQLLHNS